MTYMTPGISPARLRIEAAGKAFERRKNMTEADAWRETFSRASKQWLEEKRATDEARRRYKADRIEEALAIAGKSRRMADYATLIAAKYEITIEQLRGKSRCRSITAARQELMYECHRAGHSFVAIGRFLDRDHTTCLHGARVHADRKLAMEAAS